MQAKIRVMDQKNDKYWTVYSYKDSVVCTWDSEISNYLGKRVLSPD